MDTPQKTTLPKIDWDHHKQAVLDNLKWDERIVRHIIENNAFEVSQSVRGSEVLTTITVKPCTIELEDTFLN